MPTRFYIGIIKILKLRLYIETEMVFSSCITYLSLFCELIGQMCDFMLCVLPGARFWRAEKKRRMLYMGTRPKERAVSPILDWGKDGNPVMLNNGPTDHGSRINRIPLVRTAHVEILSAESPSRSRQFFNKVKRSMIFAGYKIIGTRN